MGPQQVAARVGANAEELHAPHAGNDADTLERLVSACRKDPSAGLEDVRNPEALADLSAGRTFLELELVSHTRFENASAEGSLADRDKDLEECRGDRRMGLAAAKGRVDRHKDQAVAKRHADRYTDQKEEAGHEDRSMDQKAEACRQAAARTR